LLEWRAGCVASAFDGIANRLEELRHLLLPQPALNQPVTKVRKPPPCRHRLLLLLLHQPMQLVPPNIEFIFII
jgi:hypothetical protein